MIKNTLAGDMARAIVANHVVLLPGIAVMRDYYCPYCHMNKSYFVNFDRDEPLEPEVDVTIFPHEENCLVLRAAAYLESIEGQELGAL